MMNSAFPDVNDSKPPLDARGMMAGCLRRWKLIVAIPLLFTLLAYIALRFVPPTYQTSAQILIFDPQSRDVSSAGQRTSDNEFDTTAINTEIEVLRSSMLLMNVAKQLKLDEYPEFQKRSRIDALLSSADAMLKDVGIGSVLQANNSINVLLKNVGLGFVFKQDKNNQAIPDATHGGAKRVQVATTILRQHIKIDRVPHSYVVTVSLSSTNARLAQRIVAGLVDEYVAEQRKARRDGLDQLAAGLAAKMSEMKTRIAERETAIEKLKVQSGLADTGKGSLNDQQIADVNAQLLIARDAVVEKRAQFEQLHGRGIGGAFPDTTAASELGQLRVQQSLLAQREAELRSKLGDRHADVIAVTAQLAAVTRAINQENARIVTDVKNSYGIAVRREQSLERSLRNLTATQTDPEDYVKLQQLQRMVDADSRLYETYLTQYTEIGSRAIVGASSQRVITPAGEPTEPSFPVPKQFYMLAAGLGLAAAVLLALLLEYLNPRVTSGAQAERMFGCSVLGVIPYVRRRTALNRGLVKVVMGTPSSVLAEAVRALRVTLQLSNVTTRQKVVLVTSCFPGEGKSTVATILAASSARTGLRVILLDCDLRGRAIRQNSEFGLTEVLSGDAAIDAVVYRDPVVGCDVISAGSRTSTPEELLASKRMSEVIDLLRAHYDYIVIDTAPLLSVVDTLALTMLADKILLVVDRNVVRRNSIAEAFRHLGADAQRIVAMVFNKVEPKKLQYYQYGGYPTRAERF